MVRAGIKRLLKVAVVCVVAVVVVLLWANGQTPPFSKSSSDCGLTVVEHEVTRISPPSNGKKKSELTGGDLVAAEEEEECEMCDHSFVFKPELKSDIPLTRKLGEETIPLFRHYSQHEAWSQLQPDYSLPGQAPTTVHYVWCSSGHFGFHHYLGVLSVLRLLQPVKLIFHHRRTPPLDKLMYNTWFLELKQSVPNLVLRPMKNLSLVPCGSDLNSLRTILSFLQQDGGVYVSCNVIITRMPRDLNAQPLWAAVSKDNGGRLDLGHGVFAANRGFDDSTKENFLRLLSSAATPTCVSQENYGSRIADDKIHCVFLPDSPPVYPKDIMHANSSFAELSRWLFYGKRSPMLPKRIPGSIPRISHFIWFNRNEKSSTELQFYQFVTLLSVLYVGGFHHIYMHGNREFTGLWWEKLKGENITFVHMEIPETVFQQKVDNIEHKSDITRYYILYKYGGAYSDFEAMWTQRVPDWLLSYPTVANSDWVQNGVWPDNINNGVLLARPRSPWLRHMLAAQRYYVDNDFCFNSILMSYRTYERHPDQLYQYRHLQVRS
ncbi:hypothetical protein V1264_019978 [Littorina saxatilis]|uniref:Uncharacterized protein n=1 Tax=Littorina saxatilis TaxID=31220 RepID=A0AAN9GB24_9CAEN